MSRVRSPTPALGLVCDSRPPHLPVPGTRVRALSDARTGAQRNMKDGEGGNREQGAAGRETNPSPLLLIHSSLRVCHTCPRHLLLGRTGTSQAEGENEQQISPQLSDDNRLGGDEKPTKAKPFPR